MKRYIRAEVINLLDEDYTLRSELARSSCSTRELAALANDEYDSVRLYVAGNPFTSEDTLLKLAVDPEIEIRKTIACRMHLTMPVAEVLLDPSNYEVESDRVSVAECIADNEYISPQILQYTWDSCPVWDVRASTARNQNVTPELTRELIMDDHFQIRMLAAHNPNTDESVLNILADDPDWEVVCEVASSPNVTPEILDKLADHPQLWVKAKVIQNRKTPIEALQRLADDPNGYVASEAKNRLKELSEK